jgi:integrase
VKSYYVQYSNNGKRKIVFSGYSLPKAKELDTKHKYKMIPEKTKSILFSEYVDKYFIPHFMQIKSAKGRINMIKRFVSALGSIPFDRVSPTMTEQTIISITKGLSPARFNSYLQLLHRVFQYAIEIEILEKNPVKMKSAKADIRKRFLSEGERKALIDSCKKSRSPRLLTMVYISLLAGLRINEVRSLKPEDIRDGCIYISAGNAKTKQGREIPMNEELTAVMNKATFDYNHKIETSFENAVKRAGLTDVHFHDLRRTFGSMLAQAGVPIFDIAKLMGHSDIRITMKVYAHLLPENLKSAVSKIKL